MVEPLRVGLIGCGGISRAHMRAYKSRPEVSLELVCDPNREAAERAAASAGLSADRIVTDWRQAVQSDLIEAVDICVPHYLHAEIAIGALNAGKHVLVEKPMACALDECRRMVAAAEESNRRLMVAQCQRYNPSYLGVKQLIDSGELGTVRAIRFDAMQNLPELVPKGHWLFDGKLAGGGIVISVAVHRIDLVRFMVGDIQRVNAITRTSRPDLFINGAEDYCVATLEFENGAVGEIFCTYAGFRMPYSESFMIFGDKGAVHALPQAGQAQGPAYVASTARDLRPADKRGWGGQFIGFAPVAPSSGGYPTEDEFVNEILHFAECCRTGREPVSSGRDNLGTMKAIFAIYESARRKAPVELAELD